MKNSIVWHKKKLVYFFVPKCGCTTLKTVFASEQGIAFDDVHFVEFERLENEIPEGYTTFAVVRNPLDRLLSLYLDKIRPGYEGWGFKDGVEEFVLAPYGVFTSCMTFEGFVNVCFGIPLDEANDHWLPQAGQVRFKDRLPDVIIRFERFSQDATDFLRVHGVNARLPHLNPSWGKKWTHWLNWYKPELRKKAIEYYKEDIELWYRSEILSSIATGA